MKKIKCTYGKECLISMAKLKGEDVLKLDFNILTYEFSDPKWQSKIFQANIIINDKLFLNEDMKNKLQETLDIFIATGDLKNDEMKLTKRGFSLLESKDLNGNKISIQKSSSAMEPKIWLGCETKNKAFFWKDNDLVPYVFEKGNILFKDRLHLNVSKAKKLKNIVNQVWDLQFKEKLTTSREIKTV